MVEVAWKGLIGGLLTALIVLASKRGNVLPGILPLAPTFAVIALLAVGPRRRLGRQDGVPGGHEDHPGPISCFLPRLMSRSTVSITGWRSSSPSRRGWQWRSPCSSPRSCWGRPLPTFAAAGQRRPDRPSFAIWPSRSGLESVCAVLEHRPEKCAAVFGQSRCWHNELKRRTESKIRSDALSRRRKGGGRAEGHCDAGIQTMARSRHDAPFRRGERRYSAIRRHRRRRA